MKQPKKTLPPPCDPRRMRGRGTLRVRGNFYWARWKYHGMTYEKSTRVPIDLTDAKGRPIARETALAVLASFVEPYIHDDESMALAVMMEKLKQEKAKADSTRGTSFTVQLQDIGQLFSKSSRRRDMTKDNLNAYIACAREFAAFFGKARLAMTITPRDAETWAEHIWKAGAAPHTYNMKICYMKVIWAALANKIGSQENPFTGIQKKRDDAKPRKVITDAEIRKILDVAGDLYGGDLKILIELGRNTGMRIGDCSTVTWEDVDFAKGMIRVTTQKTGAKVAIPMLADFKKVLEAHRNRLFAAYNAAEKDGWENYWASIAANQKDLQRISVQERYKGFVVPRMAERHFRERTLVNKLVGKLFAKAGLVVSAKVGHCSKKRPVTGFHSLRHTFISRMRMAGVSIEAAKMLVGHRSDAINDHYTHIPESFLQEEMKKLES